MEKVLWLFVFLTGAHFSSFSQADSASLAGQCFCKQDGMVKLIEKIKKDTGYEKKIPFYTFRIREYKQRVLNAQFDILLNENEKDGRRKIDSLTTRFLFFLRVDLEVASGLPVKKVQELLRKIEEDEVTFLRGFENARDFKNPFEDLEGTLKKHRNG
jgi:hypothetical protein